MTGTPKTTGRKPRENVREYSSEQKPKTVADADAEAQEKAAREEAAREQAAREEQYKFKMGRFATFPIAKGPVTPPEGGIKRAFTEPTKPTDSKEEPLTLEQQAYVDEKKRLLLQRHLHPANHHNKTSPQLASRNVGSSSDLEATGTTSQKTPLEQYLQELSDQAAQVARERGQIASGHETSPPNLRPSLAPNPHHGASHGGSEDASVATIIPSTTLALLSTPTTPLPVQKPGQSRKRGDTISSGGSEAHNHKVSKRQ